MTKQTAWALTNSDNQLASTKHIYATREDARDALRHTRNGVTTANKYSGVARFEMRTVKGRAKLYALAQEGRILPNAVFVSKKQAEKVQSLVSSLSGTTIVGVEIR